MNYQYISFTNVAGFESLKQSKKQLVGLGRESGTNSNNQRLFHSTLSEGDINLENSVISILYIIYILHRYFPGDEKSSELSIAFKNLKDFII